MMSRLSVNITFKYFFTQILSEYSANGLAYVMIQFGDFATSQDLALQSTL